MSTIYLCCVEDSQATREIHKQQHDLILINNFYAQLGSLVQFMEH